MQDFERLSGLRVAIVEDDALVSFLLEDMLQSLGCIVHGSARTVQTGLELAANAASFDVAILDINLGRERSDAVAESLRAAGIPLVFASGYDSTAANGQPQGVLMKPYTREQIGQALLAALQLEPGL